MKITRNDRCLCGSGKKFKRCCDGRDRASSGGEPLFLNEFGERMTEQEIKDAATRVMRQEGAHPAYIYAFNRLGYLVSVANQSCWTREEVADWQSALGEHQTQHPETTLAPLLYDRPAGLWVGSAPPPASAAHAWL